jgi:hypothetical protein
MTNTRIFQFALKPGGCSRFYHRMVYGGPGSFGRTEVHEMCRRGRLGVQRKVVQLESWETRGYLWIRTRGLSSSLAT